MARVTLYERAVNAVHTMTHTGEIFNKETEGGMKIKEEFVDSTISTNITDNYKFLRSRSKMCDGNKSLTENNDIPYKHVNYKTTESMPDNRSKDSNGAGLLKIINLNNRKSRSSSKHICNTSPIPKKKRKYCDKVSTNDHADASKATNKNFNGKRKRQSLAKSDIFLKNKRKKKIVNQCDVCFVTFKSSRNRKLHYHYYMKTGNFTCKYCKECFPFQRALRSHIFTCHSKNIIIDRPYMSLHCHFCNRVFKIKSYLQSHLFHTHSELIYLNNVNEIEKSKIISKGTSRKNDTLTNDIHEGSLCLSNSDESKESSTTIINNDHEQSQNDNTAMINKSIEEPFNEDTPLAKKLRQPTLNEYLELHKRKRTNLNQLDVIKSGSSTYASSDDERESLKSKFSKEAVHDRQFDVSTENSSNDLEQVSTSKHSDQNEACPSKKPFVKLHADVETMKCFLESLPVEDAKSDITQDQKNNTVSSDHDIPYRLRPVRAIRFLGHLTRKYVFKKFPHNTQNNTATEQHVVDLDTANSEPPKTIAVSPKYKDFTIPLERCDKKLRNCHPTLTTQTTLDQESVPPVTEPNAMQSKKNDIKNDVVLKELEVSLERLETEQTEDNLDLETDTEKQDDNNFTCRICKKNFSTKSARRMHIKSSHVAYMSSICNARYTVKHKLLLHYLREHTFRPNQCCVCNEICDPTQLKQHLTYHCLKYFQNENDQYSINVDIRCSVETSNSCFKCGKSFPTHILWSVHDRYCRIRGEVEEVQQDLTETNMSSEVIPKANYNEDVDESTIIYDGKTQYDTSCELTSNKYVENPNKIRPANEEVINNEEEIIEEPTIIEEDMEINGSNQNPLNRKTIFIVENIGNVNEPQQPIEFPKTNNFIINDQNVMNIQTNAPEPNGKTYPCDICGKRFQSKKNLEQHIRSFSRVTDFCPLCNTAFSSKRFLQTHIAAAHVPQLSKNYDFHCVFCNQGFVKKYDLRPHVLHLHGRQMLETIMPNFRSNQVKDDDLDNGNATCNVCNLAFETLDRYVEHRMYYYKNHKFRCSICFQDFQGMYMYHHHNKLTHYPEDKRKSYSHTCNICKEGFNHELHFHSHNMHVHSNEESSSEIMNVPKANSHITFNVEDDGEVIDLSMNQQKKIQLSSKDCICQICQLKCRNAKDLENHELFYTNDGDFKCNLCDRRCKTIHLLNQHKSLTHICGDIYKEYKCHECGEILTSVNSLICHQQHFHSLFSLDNVNHCKSCGQVFSSIIESKEHQCTSTSSISTSSISTSSKSTCSKSTSSKPTEKYIYRCFYCDMKFISLDMIQAHIIHVHFSKLLAKHEALKSDLFIVSEDKTQENTIPQLIDQVIVSRKNLTRSFQQSGNDPNSTLITREAQDKVAIEPTADQLKPLFLIDNEPQRKIPTPVITNANASETNISTMMEKGQDNQTIEDTSISASTESTNIPKKNQFLSDTFNISLEQMLDGHSIFSTGSTNKSNVTFPSISSKPVNEPNVPTAVATIPRNEEITLQKRVSVNDSTGYVCPLCLLQYPSLMYFHAHLRYAHADVIRNDLIYPQLDQLTEKIPAIECLLCPRISTDEKRYKRHLRHSHALHTNFKQISRINNASTSSTTLTNSNARSKSPEVITVEDDDDDNSKNSLPDRTVAETPIEETKHTSSIGNENVGKLKVKPFAKIIENLAIDRAIELLNTPTLSNTCDDVSTK